MSLINKMLIDLETRQDSGDKPRPRPVFEDLRPSLGMGAQRRAPRLAMAALALAASGATAWFIWSHRELPSMPTVPPAAQVAPVEAPKALISQVTPAPVTVVATATTSPMTLPDTDKVAEAPTSMTSPPVATPKIETPAASEPKARTETTPRAPKAKPESKPKHAAPRAEVPIPVTAPIATAPAEAVVIDKKTHVFTAEEQAEQLYNDGVIALKKNRRLEAEQAMRAALAKQATHVKARELLAGLYIDARRWNDATALLIDGIAAVPQHYAFAQLAARAYVEQGQNDKALALLLAAHTYAVGDADFLGFEATLLQRAGRHADAINGYRAALALRPYEPRLWVGLGISYEAQQKWRDAEDAYTHARDAGNSAPALARYANDRLAVVKSKL